MKIRANYIVDDSWTQTFDKLPEIDKNVVGLYYEWYIKENDHIQEVIFCDLCYCQNPYNYENVDLNFYKIKDEPDPHSSAARIYKNFIIMQKPYAWKYKD